MTTDVAEAVRGADLIMLVVPSVAHEHYARALAPLIDGSQPIFINPGHTGGGLHFLHELRNAGYRGPVRSCETVTLTYITRMEGPALVNIYSYTKRLRFAALAGQARRRAVRADQAALSGDRAGEQRARDRAVATSTRYSIPQGMIMNAGWIQHTGGDFLFYQRRLHRRGRPRDRGGRRRAHGGGEGARHSGDARSSTCSTQAGLTTKAARDSGDIARACRESEPNKTIKSPPSLDHRYMHEDVGYGLVPIAALGRLAGVATPTIDALIADCGRSRSASIMRATASRSNKLGLAGKSPAELLKFVEDGA